MTVLRSDMSISKRRLQAEHRPFHSGDDAWTFFGRLRCFLSFIFQDSDLGFWTFSEIPHLRDFQR